MLFLLGLSLEVSECRQYFDVLVHSLSFPQFWISALALDWEKSTTV